MRKLKEFKQMSLFKRKLVLFAILFVLAIPMAILIGRNLASRVASFDSKPFLGQFEMDEEIGESFLQLQETKKELQEIMDQMPEISTTTTSTEFSTGTPTDDVDY